MDGFRSVAVLGAGTMGHALALVHALAGCTVHIYDNSPQQLSRADDLITSACDTLIAAGALDQGEAAGARDRIALCRDLAAALMSAELVVEAIVENPAAKTALFSEVDRLAPEDAVIASNTSHLDVFPLIPETRRPLSAIAHWYTPPYIIDLVDLAPGPETGSGVVARLESFYRRMGKRPVVFETFVQGYIANRLQSAISLEVAHLLDAGLATPQMIDQSIRYGLSLRMVLMGHLMKQDYTGLDMAQRAFANATYRPPEPRGRCDTLDRLIKDGRAGVMSGAGFYDYGGRTAEGLLRERDLNLLRLKALQTAIDAGGSNDPS